MAELLIKASDSPVSDGPGKWYAALIVTVQEDGHEWGSKEGPPKFYILKIPGISKDDAQEYLTEWRHGISYEVVNSQPAQDGYRIKLTSDAVSVSGKGSITLENVEAFFTKWNATVQSATSNSITFDVRIYDAATSEGFWERDVSGITFSETTYEQATGSHLIEVVSPEITDDQIQNVCERQSVVYVAPRSMIVTRSEVRTKFQDDIKEQFERIDIARRRWHIKSAGMDALQQAGGIMTVTPTQFLNNVTDGFAD